MFNLVNSSIRNKLILAFLSILLLTIGLGVFSVVRLNQVAAASTDIVSNDALNIPLANILKDINEISALAAVEQVAAQSSALPSIQAKAADVVRDELSNWNVNAQTMNPGQETAEGNTVQADFKSLAASFTQIGHLDAANNQAAGAAMVIGPLQDQTQAARQAMDLDYVYQTNQSAGLAKAAAAADRSSTISIIAVLGLLLLLSISIITALVKIVAGPIATMTDAMRKLADGDFGVTVLGTGRTDEIGGMGRAVQVFKEAGLQKLRLESDIETARIDSHARQNRHESERAKAAAEQELVVSSIATGLGKLSDGDLVFRLHTPFAAEYEKLRSDFNGTLERLQETMKSIASNTRAVHAGASEITQASDDLSRRTEQQAASLEQTAAALDQITTTVRRTAEGADEARKIVASSSQDAESSGAVIHETVAAMNDIEKSAKEIGTIIGVIDEIAFQTNLLALNAGIEAARAGDAGRGFAVVATEVRALAQRSTEAAKEIKTLISASGQQVDTGVKLVGQTGTALGRIVGQVTRLSGLIAEIAASAKEQASGLSEVNLAVNQMDQVTQQNAAMVEQSTAASHSLAAEASELGQLVAEFQLGDSDGTGAVRPAGLQHPAAAPANRAAARRTAGRFSVVE